MYNSQYYKEFLYRVCTEIVVWLDERIRISAVSACVYRVIALEQGMHQKYRVCVVAIITL